MAREPMGMEVPELDGPIAYLTGEYPRATDTFIQREVAAMRQHGVEVVTCSIRKTPTNHHVGVEQREEAARTFYVLAALASPWAALRAHACQFFGQPGRYASAFGLALRTSQPGIRGLAYQLVYFAEAIVLAHELNSRGVVHLHNHIAKSSCTVAMLASRASGIPFSFTLHGPDIFFEPTIWRLDAKVIEASFVACISDFCRSQAMIFAPPDTWPKLKIVHCGIEPGRYDSAEHTEAPQAFTAERPLRLLFVGRLAAVKGLRVLLDAIGQFDCNQRSRLRMTLIGDGVDRVSLEREVASRGLGKIVSFEGYRSQDEVAEALSMHDALILPSFAEGLPVVLMEALASSRPVIATRIAGVPELVVDGEAGWLVAPGNAQDLAAAINKALTEPSMLVQMGLAGRARVISDFDVTIESQRLLGYIAGLRSETSGTSPPQSG